MRQTYSEEFKKSAVQKILSRGSRSVELICEEMGVPSPSVYKWLRRYGTVVNMKKTERRPQDWSATEKLNAVIAYEGLSEDQRGEFLRREGLHSDHVVAWKKSMTAGLEVEKKLTAQERAERSEDKKKIRELERDLNRKDKALAETAALLVLKKKANLLWGTGENE